MNRRIRLACELGVQGLIWLGVFTDRIPAAIGIPLGIVGLLASFGYSAFQVHDRNRSDKTTTLDLHR